MYPARRLDKVSLLSPHAISRSIDTPTQGRFPGVCKATPTKTLQGLCQIAGRTKALEGLLGRPPRAFQHGGVQRDTKSSNLRSNAWCGAHPRLGPPQKAGPATPLRSSAAPRRALNLSSSTNLGRRPLPASRPKKTSSSAPSGACARPHTRALRLSLCTHALCSFCRSLISAEEDVLLGALRRLRAAAHPYRAYQRCTRALALISTQKRVKPRQPQAPARGRTPAHCVNSVPCARLRSPRTAARARATGSRQH